MAIYIATHKNFKVPNLDKIYIPLQVGASGKKNLGYLKDNTGDNISEKNANYCELTGLYWAWKNDNNSKIKGLVHYRRYFTKYRFSVSAKGFLCENEINQILNEYDIILSKKEYFKETAWEEYHMVCGLEKDLKRVEKILREYYPEYLPAFNKYFSGNVSSLFNMMICKSDLFDEYCQWLFDILFQLEKEIDWKEYDDYQKRLFGFMSERLLNVWVIHKGLRIKEYRTVNTEMKFMDRVRIWLRRYKNKYLFAHR